jgi:hypothetical protein
MAKAGGGARGGLASAAVPHNRVRVRVSVAGFVAGEVRRVHGWRVTDGAGGAVGPRSDT